MIGDLLTISFDPSSREFNGRWYTSLRAWRITLAGGTAVDRPSTMGVVDQQPPQQVADAVPHVDTSSAPSYQDENAKLRGEDEDLPF